MRKLTTAVLAVVCLLASSVQAIQMSTSKSNNMVKTCTAYDGDVSEAACQAFVLGVVDTTAFYATAKQVTPLFCIPVDTSSAEVVAVYRKYLKEHHSLRQFSAAFLAVSAFRNTYPCQQTATP